MNNFLTGPVRIQVRNNRNKSRDSPPCKIWVHYSLIILCSNIGTPKTSFSICDIWKSSGVLKHFRVITQHVINTNALKLYCCCEETG